MLAKQNKKASEKLRETPTLTKFLLAFFKLGLELSGKISILQQEATLLNAPGQQNNTIICIYATKRKMQFHNALRNRKLPGMRVLNQ